MDHYKKGTPIVYHLDDGDTLPGIFLAQFGDKGAARLHVMFNADMYGKYADKENWFSKEFLDAHDLCVPEVADHGSQPGEFQFAAEVGSSELVFRAKSHPEANGAKAAIGDVAYRMWFPLEDGRKLTVEMGREGMRSIRDVVLAELCDDESAGGN